MRKVNEVDRCQSAGFVARMGIQKDCGLEDFCAGWQSKVLAI